MQLASLFQDGAVFQRNAVIPVWGKTAANTLVIGKFHDSTVYCRSSASGEFKLFFPEENAGGPFTLEISAGDDHIEVRDILVGEVWLASGQSNMQYQLQSNWQADKKSMDEPLSSLQQKEFTAQTEHLTNFRYFNVAPVASNCEETYCRGEWKAVDPACSAVGAWFGLYLQKELDVPIGIIVSAWGGTIAEAWMSQSALCANPKTRNIVSACRANQWDIKNFEDPENNTFAQRVISLLRPDGKNEGFEAGFHTRSFDDSTWQTMAVPNSWIRQGFAGNGAVWVRRKITLPESWKSADLLFCASAIDKQDISYFNGVEIGRTGSGASLNTYNQPRRYPIPAKINDSCEAVIAVRGYSACYDGSFVGEWYLENCATGETLDITGDWKLGVELDIGIARPKLDKSIYGPGNPNTPSILFDSMIRPLIPYAIAGTLWYQGESNAGTIEHSTDYFELLKNLIEDWRYFWQTPEMPFFIVQLAGYGKNAPYRHDSAWAHLRESQRLLAKNHHGTYIATAIDCGDERDIHPQDKESVGYRLAMCALNKVYRRADIVPGGPELLRAENAAPGCVRLDFAWSEGMHLDEEAEQSFYLSGDGEEFIPADRAEVRGNAVFLASSKLDCVRRVRYAWGDFTVSTLYNADGFPALPFDIEVI